MVSSERIKVTGEILLNGILSGADFHVYLGDCGLHISTQEKLDPNFSIYTFGRAMTNALDFALLSKPIEYLIEGTILGMCTQNFGDIREPDFYNRHIKRIKITIIYSANAVTYNLAGLAVAPDGLAPHDEIHPAGDWDFRILFRVSKEDIPRFYSLTPTATESYMAAMGSL
jgi:hypothetical protein